MLIVCTHACNVKDATVNVCVCSRDCDFEAFGALLWCHWPALKFSLEGTKFAHAQDSCSSVSVCLLSILPKTAIKAHNMLAETQTNVTGVKAFICSSNIICVFFLMVLNQIIFIYFGAFQKCHAILNFTFSLIKSRTAFIFMALNVPCI